VPALIVDKGQNGDIFLDGPASLADIGVEVIEPVLAALFGSFIVLAF
jgi:hypothetical protein